ncbi:small acid-soluble spore protein Tlp [Alkalicoccobacillus murimartini]|uniref:Small, acid-soluble spore protein Tlp n=1 Tax=Alkalicoccobacillus murimartini TaxID=171685 RepID=A0ABT9YDX0_9BACI|nr:small acid-soluble spore protein Tlp [Alkalicoccobacillus murimartini]MDQ0205828.1 small acid-soluble spore protein (thioredoxin-like protein) [Alkalicoccobacillus murimartini]
MANPDNREDNAKKIEQIISNTEQKIDQSKDFIAAHGHEMAESDKQDISDKNERRETSINSLRNEIEDES